MPHACQLLTMSMHAQLLESLPPYCRDHFKRQDGKALGKAALRVITAGAEFSVPGNLSAEGLAALQVVFTCIPLRSHLSTSNNFTTTSTCRHCMRAWIGRVWASLLLRRAVA